MFHGREIGEKIKEMLKRNISAINGTIGEGQIKQVEVKDICVIVRLQGVFDASTIPIVQERHKDYKNQLDKHIIIDFKDVKHIDCSTVAILVDLFMQLKSHNKRLVIINATEQLIGYMDILKLKPVINIFFDEKDAITYLTSS